MEATPHSPGHEPSYTRDGDSETFYKSDINLKFSPWIKLSLAGRQAVWWVVLRNRDDGMCGEYCKKSLQNTQLDLMQSGVLVKTCGVIKGGLQII